MRYDHAWGAGEAALSQDVSVEAASPGLKSGGTTPSLRTIPSAPRSACAFFALFCLLFLLLAPSLAALPPKVVTKPNLDVYVYRRSYVPSEKVQVRLSTYNISSAQFTAYKMDLPRVVKNSAGLTNFGKTLKALSLQGLPVAATWRFSVGKTYPDQWAERAVTLPHLPPGVYVIAARGPGVEKRTWLDVTDVALLMKRSRQETLVSATDANTGRPLPGLSLTIYDGRGARAKVATDGDGLIRFPSAGPDAEWVYGERSGSPAFALASLPPEPDPYSVFTVTDRPIYRPGQTVQYKATLRTRTPAPVPGGVALSPLANKPVTVEIRDATDALLSRQVVPTNANGSLAGSFQLASEPTLGRWQLVFAVGEHRYYGAFEVQAYRKPEMTLAVTFGKPHYLGGSKVPVDVAARYYFGQPVANAPVTYQIAFNGDDAEPSYDGQGITDAQGHLHLEIATQRRKSDRELSVSATVTDLSRRSQTGSGSTLIAAGLFRLSLETDKSVYRTGEPVVVTVHSADYDGKPVPARVKVRLVETKYDRQRRPYEVATVRDVQTNAKGVGTATFSSPRPGDLTLDATAFDADDDKIAAAGSVWIAGDDYADYDYPTLALVAGRTEYAPGQAATILLNTSLVKRLARAATRNTPAQAAHPDAYALVTVEGERLGRAVRLHLTQHSTLLRLPLTDKDFPSVSVNVAIVQDHQVYEEQVRLSVLRKEQKLTVSVASDKVQYQPGETAAYTVTTRDYLGRAVPAELSLGVVDASIYALAADATADPASVFYPDQEVRVQTEFSFAAQYSGGAFQHVAAVTFASVPAMPPPPPTIRVRRQFADTAYWNPFVATDTDGTARVTFSMPDNLTTWRATAHGVTLSTAVGSATAEAVSTMPLLVRLALPRFYVVGDRAVVSAIVQNYSGEARTVRVTMEAHGATLMGDAARTVQLAAGGQERLDWRAQVGVPPSPNPGGVRIGAGEDVIGASPGSSPTPPGLGEGGLRFTVTADGGAGAQDATETTLPTLTPGLKVVTASAVTLADPSAQDRFDLTALPPNATITLTLSPSIAASLFPALDYLTSYPYGCAEQTMSSFLPDVAVAQALKQRGADRLPPAALAKQVNLGLQKLYRYQHADGGWNWWEFDQTDGDMTAYVLSGLIAARRAGYLVDDQRILRGTEALKGLLKDERELSRRADWLLALSDANPRSAVKPLHDLYAKRDHLDAYGQASLCLALSQTGDANKAQALAQSLEARAVVRGRLASWTDEEGGYSWRDDNAAVTAHVLRALLAVQPKSALLPSVVRWLLSDRQGNAWGTTRTTAEVVLALAKSLETTGELSPDFTAHVALDGVALKDLSATAANVYDAPTALTLTPAQLVGHGVLTVDKTGPGTLYLSRVVASLLPPDQATPQSHGLSVRRVYRVSAEDPSQADTQASGSEMDVQVEITADSDYRYVQLEDPLPAGCEVVSSDSDDGRYPLDSSEGVAGYTRQEVRDDRVVFFFDSLPKGRTRLTYKLRAETPGAYQVLPDLASLTYYPEIRGNSGLVRAKIGERP